MVFRCLPWDGWNRVPSPRAHTSIAPPDGNRTLEEFDNGCDVSVDGTTHHVFTDGRLVASNGKMVIDVVEGPSDPPYDTMKLAHLEPADMLLRLDAPDGWHRMRVIADAVMTRWDESDVSVTDGFVDPPDGDIVQEIARHHGVKS